MKIGLFIHAVNDFVEVVDSLSAQYCRPLLTRPLDSPPSPKFEEGCFDGVGKKVRVMDEMPR